MSYILLIKAVRICFVLATVLTLSVRAAGPTDGLSSTPAELAYKRVTLSDEQNAAVEWLRAVPLLVAPDDALKETLRTYWTLRSKPLTEEQQGKLRQWLDQNHEALALIEASVLKPKAQWPVRKQEEFESGLSAVRHLAQARLAQAGQLTGKKLHTAAAEHLLRTLRLAELVTDGEGPLIHYLVGNATQTLVLQAMLKLAAEEQVGAPALEQLLNGLAPSDREAEVFCRAVRVEFQDYVLKQADWRKLADQWQETTAKSPDALHLIAPEPLTRVFLVFLTPTLVAQHPHPFDQERQIKATIPNFLRYLANVRTNWSNQLPEPDSEELAEAFLEDAEEILAMVKDEPLPLAKRAADRIRPAYNRFENPVGRLFEALPTPLGAMPNRVFRARTEREVTRVMLAIRLFKLREQRWPHSLQELVTNRLLAKVPTDPFSDRPVQYDRSRLVVWSVGEDGEDDDGEESAKPRWAADDAVWKLNPSP